jgi:hypothetical protein
VWHDASIAVLPDNVRNKVSGTEQTGFQKHLAEEAAKPKSTAGLYSPVEQGPTTVNPVTFTDRPNFKDFRALDIDEIPKDIKDEIDQELDADPTMPPAGDAPEGVTEPEEMLLPKSQDSLPSSSTDASDGKSKPPVEDSPPATPIRRTPGSPSVEKTES